MTKLRFSDGVEIETSGRYRIIEEVDGLYVTGNGTLIPVKNREEGERVLARLAPKSPE